VLIFDASPFWVGTRAYLVWPPRPGGHKGLVSG